MEPIDILLVEEGDPNSGFRTRNAEGDKARSVLIDRGDILALRACLTGVAHGDYAPDGGAATLLVFEFTFLSMKQSRQFKKAKIILTFEDVSGDLRNRPEVVNIAPAGKFFINKTTDSHDVKQSVNTILNGSVAGVGGGSIGYVWEISQTKKTDHATTIVGMKRLFADYGKDNGVIWNLEEDGVKKAGIPSLLRTAVLLRRRDDVPFRFTIKVETDVDFEGWFRRMIGLGKPEAVDPVELDNDTDLGCLGIDGPDPGAGVIDLKNMRGKDLREIAQVELASFLTREG